MFRETGVLVEWNNNYSRNRKNSRNFDICKSHTLGYLLNYANLRSRRPSGFATFQCFSLTEFRGDWRKKTRRTLRLLNFSVFATSLPWRLQFLHTILPLFWRILLLNLVRFWNPSALRKLAAGPGRAGSGRVGSFSRFSTHNQQKHATRVTTTTTTTSLLVYQSTTTDTSTCEEQ